MPRASAEAKSAAAFRAGGRAPEPPPHLTKEAADVWREIAASKPSDWFDPGACVLLEDFCNATIHARAISRKVERMRKLSGRSCMNALVIEEDWPEYHQVRDMLTQRIALSQQEQQGQS